MKELLDQIKTEIEKGFKMFEEWINSTEYKKRLEMANQTVEEAKKDLSEKWNS